MIITVRDLINRLQSIENKDYHIYTSTIKDDSVIENNYILLMETNDEYKEVRFFCSNNNINEIIEYEQKMGNEK